MRTPVDARKGLNGWHVLGTLVAFFGIVFAVNAYFIRVALSTHSGTLGPNSYRAGLKYNERIAAGDRQSKLGWQDEITLTPAGDRLTVSVKDRDGDPVPRLTVSATLGRPATDRDDVTVTLKEEARGRYEIALPQRPAGTYMATVEIADPANSGREIVYRARKRLWLTH